MSEHMTEGDEWLVMDEDHDAQAEFLRSLGLDPDTATRDDLLEALRTLPGAPS